MLQLKKKAQEFLFKNRKYVLFKIFFPFNGWVGGPKVTYKKRCKVFDQCTMQLFVQILKSNLITILVPIRWLRGKPLSWDNLKSHFLSRNVFFYEVRGSSELLWTSTTIHPSVLIFCMGTTQKVFFKWPPKKREMQIYCNAKNDLYLLCSIKLITTSCTDVAAT